MWRKSEGRAPRSCVAIKFRCGDIDFTTVPGDWIWDVSETQDDIGDIIEYDDGQEPEGQGDDIASQLYTDAECFQNEPHFATGGIAYPSLPLVGEQGPGEYILPRPHFSADMSCRLDHPAMRTFETGATRHSDTDKYDYEGFLSPIALEAFAAYMHVNRRTADGGLRDSDNWQKGIPVNAYIKSKWRHDVEMWKAHRGYPVAEGELAAACGVLFNTMGWIHERAKADPQWFERELETFKQYRAAEIAARGK